jgi:hypothetical protein
LGSLDPFSVATRLVIVVAVGMRDAGCWTKDCFSTVIRPPEAAAYCWNWA